MLPELGYACDALAPGYSADLLQLHHSKHHQGNIGNGTAPILVMDRREHAFYLQYRNEKKRWMQAFWKMINWQDVATRFDRVQHLDLGL